VGVAGEAEVEGARRAEDVTDQACREGCGALRSRGKQIHARERWKGALYMRLKLICAVLVGVLLIAPGCGSKKKTTSTTTKATTSTTTTKATTSTTTTSATGGLNLTSTDCKNLIAAESTISQATSGKLPSDFDQQIAHLNALASGAPAAVKGDIVTLADAAKQISKLNLPSNQKLTAAQTAQLMAAVSKLDIKKISAAAADLGAWAQKACASK
jgi:hypothetical protein